MTKQQLEQFTTAILREYWYSRITDSEAKAKLLGLYEQYRKAASIG